MIPKTIHYCWFGSNPLPPLAIKCINSWKKKCPDYKIIEWNESNYDISTTPLYVRQAYEAKKWAFVTDYVRLDVVYQNGGVYLDTDVQIIKKLDRFLKDIAFFGFQDEAGVATGLGFGAVKGSLILKDLMKDYEEAEFILKDGTFDDTPCPSRNLSVFLKYGLKQNGSEQILDGGTHIYPMEFFCPMDFKTGIVKKTRNTATIHWFSASWHDEEERKRIENRRRNIKKDRMIHLPNRILMNILGRERYEDLKELIKEKGTK